MTRTSTLFVEDSRFLKRYCREATSHPSLREANIARTTHARGSKIHIGAAVSMLMMGKARLIGAGLISSLITTMAMAEALKLEVKEAEVGEYHDGARRGFFGVSEGGRAVHHNSGVAVRRSSGCHSRIVGRRFNQPRMAARQQGAKECFHGFC
jgi:hypothetical protein